MDMQGILDEVVEQVGDQVGGDGVHADDLERERPGAEILDVNDAVKCRHQEKTPATAVESPGGSPDSFDARANAEVVQPEAEDEAEESGEGKFQKLLLG